MATISATSILTTLAGSVKAGAATSWATFVTDLTGVGIGLLGEEAQDFDTFVTNFTQGVEAGQTYNQAFQAAWNTLVTTEKSQGMQAALNVLAQVATFLDSINAVIQAVL